MYRQGINNRVREALADVVEQMSASENGQKPHPAPAPVPAPAPSFFSPKTVVSGSFRVSFHDNTHGIERNKAKKVTTSGYMLL